MRAGRALGRRVRAGEAGVGFLPLPRLLLISRPALWINTVGVLVSGLWLSGVLVTPNPGFWALLLYLTLPYNLLIYGLNDLSDSAEDALSARKGSWQGARLAPTEAGSLKRSLLALNLPFLPLLAWLLPPPAFALVLLAGLLFAGYSLPPLRFKALPLLDGLSNVAYALPLALPALLLGHSPPWLALLALCAYSLGKHSFDAVQDIEADRAAGLRTSATVLGPRGTAAYALACFALGAWLLWQLSRLGGGPL
ncbi:MAG: UbiA family prenyltransferase, partial [Deinococcus sp.]